MAAVRSVEFLLIGGGVASYNCARQLRRDGADGEILLVGREPDLPYDRPPLSKEYVRGEKPKEEVLFETREWYEEQDVDVLTMTSVMSLDPAERVAKLSNKEEIRFEKALLATGSNVRVLHAEGAQRDGIHYLRTLRNCDAIRDELERAERAALIGGSFIGVELAASFRALGKECSLVMLEDVPFERVFGREAGQFFQTVLTEHGVSVHGSEELDHFEGSSDRVQKFVTKSGREVECDFVVMGTGVHPEIRLAEHAGLETATGVITDRFLATSAPGVYAAGDVAEYDSVVHNINLRIEHWDVAFNQGKAAARNMLGKNEPYQVVPYFWSDLADWTSIECVGPPSEWDEIWWRGRPEEGSFTAWYVKSGRLAGALAVGRSEDLQSAREALAKGADVSQQRELLEDPEGDLSAALVGDSS